MKKYQYRSIHTAIAAVYGKPSKCEICNGKKQSKRFEWSNKNHKYTLLRKDWWELCAKCHREFDRKKFGYKTWNKGMRGKQPWHNLTGLNNGIPWNKDRKLKIEVKCICGINFYPPKKTSTFCSKSCASRGNKRASNLLENKLITP